MSHLPFIVPESNDVLLTDGTLDPDVLRSQSDPTASSLSSTSATSSLMAPKSASSSRLPGWLRFPLVVIVSLGVSATLYSFVPDVAGFQLATVSRSLNEPWQIGALLLWRVTELAIAWNSGLDFFDFMNFFLLSNAPYYALLGLFYEISVYSILLSLAIDLFSNVLPFYLLRRTNAHNVAIAHASNPNASLAHNSNIRLHVTLFAAALYSVLVYSSFYTWLPVYLVTHFDSIRTLEYAHNASLPVLLLAFIPLGFAAKDFLFTASIANARSQVPQHVFNARTASFPETLAYNVGLSRWSKREEMIVKRTALLVFMTFASSFAKIYGTVEGAEEVGALVWGGVFAAAHLANGIGFAWVGDV